MRVKNFLVLGGKMVVALIVMPINYNCFFTLMPGEQNLSIYLSRACLNQQQQPRCTLLLLWEVAVEAQLSCLSTTPAGTCWTHQGPLLLNAESPGHPKVFSTWSSKSDELDKAVQSAKKKEKKPAHEALYQCVAPMAAHLTYCWFPWPHQKEDGARPLRTVPAFSWK